MSMNTLFAGVNNAFAGANELMTSANNVFVHAKERGWWLPGWRSPSSRFDRGRNWVVVTEPSFPMRKSRLVGGFFLFLLISSVYHTQAIHAPKYFEGIVV